MDETLLNQDINTAEELDETVYNSSAEMEDISGSLEAITQAVVAEDEPVYLTDHQQDAVTEFKNLTKNQKDTVYAVIDKAALEGFLDVSSALARRSATAFNDSIGKKFYHTSKALEHYAALGQKLKARLEELKPLLEKRDFPLVDVFEYGTYSRFFQLNGKGVGSFTHFQDAVNVQVIATKYVFTAASSYSNVIAQKLLTSLQELQSTRQPETATMVALRDSIERYWLQTWKEADITPLHGETPQSALNAFPTAKFTSIAPLLDNRYLVAYQPKNNGGTDPAKISIAIKDYGVAVVFDKSKIESTQKFMNIPNCKDLLAMVDQTINMLSDFKLMGQLAKQNTKVSAELHRATEILIKQMTSESDKQYFGFITEYFKLFSAIAQVTQEPYAQVSWMFIRTAMVVITLAELSVLEDPNKQIVTKRFFTKQNEEFSNIATESFETTQKALKAARNAVIGS